MHNKIYMYFQNKLYMIKVTHIVSFAVKIQEKQYFINVGIK